MFNSTAGAGGYGSYRAQQGQSLTNDQRQGLKRILDNHDPKSLTQSDARRIVTEIGELGLSAGPALGRALKTAGFDPKMLGGGAKMLGGGAKPAPPPAKPDRSDEAAVTVLKKIVSELSDTQDPEAFKTQLAAKLEEAGISTNRPIVDRRA